MPIRFPVLLFLFLSLWLLKSDDRFVSFVLASRAWLQAGHPGSTEGKKTATVHSGQFIQLSINESKLISKVSSSLNHSDQIWEFLSLRPLMALHFSSGFFFFFRAAPVAYGSSQARGWIGATADGLHHSHSNMGSEPGLWPTAHHNAGSLTHQVGQGLNPRPHGS